jgi:hypothetical protein
MSFVLNSMFSLSIAISAIIGWIRFKKIEPAFFPFLCLLWLGMVNETLSITLAMSGHSNACNYNVFSLVEALLVTWQFRRWNLFSHRFFYPVMQLVLIMSWLFINFILGHIYVFNSWFFILHAILIVVLSINMMNRVIFEDPGNIFRNPVFLISMGLIIYFTYSILVEVFWLYGLNKSREFRINIYAILAYINLFTNLMFALATIWMPLKRQFILPS